MARKKENSVAARRDSPNSMPPMMVAPERDVPGMSANACARPILSASVARMSSTSSMCGGARVRARRSTHRMTKPPAMNAIATGRGANSTALIARLNSRPRMAAGRKAIARLMAKRCACRSRGSPAITRARRARYSQHTARMAPAWITISNALACSPV
jgi:hypothetical protein